MSDADVVVVGGGIAGLSVAAALAPRLRVTVVERESTLAAQASGRNAAIYRPLENDHSTGELAKRTLAILRRLEGLASDDWLDRCGLVLVSAHHSTIAEQAQRAREQHVGHDVVAGESLWALAPWLRGGQATAGVWLPGGGVLDIHAMAQGLERRARQAGARFVLGTEVASILTLHGRICGVALSDGGVINCRNTVIGAGAWSRTLGAAVGADLPLVPVRRHLFQLEFQEDIRNELRLDGVRGPVIWRLEQEMYARVEGRGVLASPCDELAWAGPIPTAPVPDPAVAAMLADKTTCLAPVLSNGGTRAVWACFRTFASDRELVAGPDPRVPGLHWLTGLGGRGMAVGVAAGDLVARRLLGEHDRLADALGVERLLR